jgi:diguanylate cyclase (GGDEF)-like protein
LLYFDLDGFKQINDSFGHAEGDRALRKFAQALLVVFRESDVIGRIGGDEFVVLLAGTSDIGGSVAINRLKDWISADRHANDPPYRIGFSCGQVQFDPNSRESIEDLLAQADSAMYRDKRSRR